jgi:hypothetical protein
MRQSIGVVVVLVVAACGSSDGGNGTADAPGSGGDAPVGMTVPDPGSGAIPFSWQDTEPNNTPAGAVALGTSTGAGEATWFDGTATSGTLGGSDTSDYFVFRSSPQGGNFHAGPCWDGSAAPNLLDFYIYKVAGGQVGAMVGSSVTTDPACENVNGSADITMEPSTVYLLELRATAGSPSTVYAA